MIMHETNRRGRGSENTLTERMGFEPKIKTPLSLVILRDVLAVLQVGVHVSIPSHKVIHIYNLFTLDINPTNIWLVYLSAPALNSRNKHDTRVVVLIFASFTRCDAHWSCRHVNCFSSVSARGALETLFLPSTVPRFPACLWRTWHMWGKNTEGERSQLSFVSWFTHVYIRIYALILV